jgi:hypothetical protein
MHPRSHSRRSILNTAWLTTAFQYSWHDCQLLTAQTWCGRPPSCRLQKNRGPSNGVRRVSPLKHELHKYSKNSIRTSRRTHCVYVTDISPLKLLKKIIPLCCVGSQYEEFINVKIDSVYNMNCTLEQWYSTVRVLVPPDVSYLQLCARKDFGA